MPAWQAPRVVPPTEAALEASKEGLDYGETWCFPKTHRSPRINAAPPPCHCIPTPPPPVRRHRIPRVAFADPHPHYHHHHTPPLCSVRPARCRQPGQAARCLGAPRKVPLAMEELLSTVSVCLGACWDRAPGITCQVYYYSAVHQPSVDGTTVPASSSLSSSWPMFKLGRPFSEPVRAGLYELSVPCQPLQVPGLGKCFNRVCINRS